VILWIESQRTGVILLLVFGLCYALAAVIFAAALLVSRGRITHHLKATTPVMLTPLSVIAGLLIAFLASRVWSNLDHANAFVAQEASAIRQFLILTDGLPDDIRTSLHSSVRNYIHFLEVEDWPAMNESRASLQVLPADLITAMRTLLDYVPTRPGQQLAQQRAVIALEQLLEARRGRITLSQAVIEPIQWIVIFVLATLVLLTVAMVHVDKPATAAVNLFIFATAVAASLALLMVNDRPLTAGGYYIGPTALQTISPG
jgi:hypothetical protein